MVSSDCNPTEQQARQGHLDALYLADGRDNPDHPMHALYTGLAQAAQQQQQQEVEGGID